MSTPLRIHRTTNRRRLSLGYTGMHGERLIFGVKVLTIRSCYNAFSRLDMRVDVKIPGGVESYCIDERGDKRVASEALWLETFLCSVLRAYSYADDGSGDTIKKIIGVRRFDPITSTEVEHRFLDAAERLFFKGMASMSCFHRFGLMSFRMAAWVGTRNPGSKSRLKPSHNWSHQLHTHNWTLCIWHQSLRETAQPRP